ncbi:fatty acid hydroxylase [Nocardioides psychrotolerans]|uniref:Fatty acid hydroxylase superfamily protein n=1 Tax=Nocardioides psychrotolerans TaxID=1005945 RepID=A0A1I3GGT9_9ACTN|nr:sterol desaturase family protein [Nocardioides psychrotolerans]GEP39898.1 fatty acid hydroxylase [Nocardioides psychrotolerans]SFI22653.1 Fatty acid hydroxylase superfamily protein [Nocardioides psychrotolerans]
MTKPSPEIEALAAERLAQDTTAATRRTAITLGQAWRAFWRHPSPPMIAAALVAATAARVVHGGGDTWQLVIPVGLVALFPAIEWVIHVVVLHWRPRRVGPVRIDSLLAREHRAHHADPRDIPLVFIPWKALLWLVPAGAAAALVALPTGSALTLLVSATAMMFAYEWTHYLVHSDYKPSSRAYRAVWRNHRLHHYKNEHYWFTVTTSGTADRLFGTYPDPADVPTSPTVRKLHESSPAPATITG